MQEDRLALIHLLADPPAWRSDDEPRLTCECKFQIHRADGSFTESAPILQLADSLRLCLERTMNTRAMATEFLWDTGLRVSVSMSGRGLLTVELPVGTEPLVIAQDELIGFISDCYSRGMSALAQFPTMRGYGS
jgi:hypothetical protein